MLERLFALEHFGVKLGLDNIRTLCTALGHPERTFPSIHVAGTNGKGSVTAMVHAIYQAGGFRAGRFTSPHLTDLRERFVIGDDLVDPGTLTEVAGQVLDCAAALKDAGVLPVHPTFFEATTAIAFELFRRERVDVAIIEVGLGGRYDSTNVIDPIVGAITSIGFDHEQYLGHTLEAIAFEKAGIIKPGMDVVIGDLPAEARHVVEAVAVDRGAHLVASQEGSRIEVDVETGRLTFETPDDRYGPLSLALAGDHQAGNALTALRVIESARRRGLPAARSAMEQGLERVDWPGRLEWVRLPEGSLLLDAAHNPDGARALAAYLRQHHPQRVTFVLGIMRDKDLPLMFDALAPQAAAIVATAADTVRALPARDLALRIRALAPALEVHVEPDPTAAIERALASGRLACVTGSIFLVGAVRDGLRRRAILRESSDSR